MEGINKIEIIQPKPFERVRAEFILRGRIHESCLKTSEGRTDYRVLGGFVDINGFEFSSMVTADVQSGLFSWFTKKLNFSTKVQFSEFNIPFIKKSGGRVALKLTTSKEGCFLFLPLIVDGFETANIATPEIIERHGKIEELIKQYEGDLKEYYREMEKIKENSSLKINVTENNDWFTVVDITDKELLKKIIKILSSSESEFKNQYEIAIQAHSESLLAEKYKLALKWRGPLLRGVIKNWKGFMLQIYSDDHGNHFHIKHPGRNIDIRMSFPELKILDDNNTNALKSREVKAIKSLFKDSKLFAKAEKEFNKRPKK